MATLSLREKVKRLGKSSQDRTLGNAHEWIREEGIKARYGDKKAQSEK